MYESAQPQLDIILQLVARCPEHLQVRCFEMLLDGYVRTQVGGQAPPSGHDKQQPREDNPPSPESLSSHGIPAEIENRFKATAKRIGVELEALASLFDFNSDPFTFHALHVAGERNSAKTRDVGLLVAAKGYLATGQWIADWKEVRAQCVDQNCYDRTNMGSYLKHEYFKSASADAGVALSGSGIKAAETLLAKMAGRQE